MIKTAETVTFLHPDKICDQISDAIVDACLAQDPKSRVAVETIGGHGTIVLIGEVTTNADVNFGDVAATTYYNLTRKTIGVLSNISKQAPEIAQGVNRGGAGDQGIMVGYACTENDAHIPQELFLARDVLDGYVADGKSQITLEDGKIDKVVLSVQGESKHYLETEVKMFLDNYAHKPDVEVFCNNTGSFTTGGFDADSGVTGRKIVVDAYGPQVPVGGGAFSGKDPTKVDRSGAYMARFIALETLKKFGAKEVIVRIGYVIGGIEPVMVQITADGIPFHAKYDCRPEAIIERFDLRRPIYQDLAKYGHFGRKELAWEKI